jgi:hypothetical protein
VVTSSDPPSRPMGRNMYQINNIFTHIESNAVIREENQGVEGWRVR